MYMWTKTGSSWQAKSWQLENETLGDRCWYIEGLAYLPDYVEVHEPVLWVTPHAD
jgi:hypothetical protein